jgi:hypothetical protein
LSRVPGVVRLVSLAIVPGRGHTAKPNPLASGRVVGKQEVIWRIGFAGNTSGCPVTRPKNNAASLGSIDERGQSQPDQRVPTMWDRPHGKRPLAIHAGATEQSCVGRGGGGQGELKSCAAPGDTGGP